MVNRSSDALKFLRVMAILSMCIFAVDFLTGAGLKYLYSKQRSGLLYRTTYAIDSTTASVILVGSSRANHNYDPRVFENLLKSSFYNCGRDKQGILYSCAIVSAITRRYRPKQIIIDVRPDEFTQSDQETLAALLPYTENPAIKPYLQYNSRFENLKLYSKIYPYNSLLTNLIVGLKPNWKEDFHGYVRLTARNQDSSIVAFNENNSPDTLKIRVFKTLIAELDRRGINVQLVISPVHYRVSNPFTTKVCDDIVRHSRWVTYVNFNNQVFWEDNTYYSDNNHLNNQGAIVFSTQLSDYLLKLNSLNRHANKHSRAW